MKVITVGSPDKISLKMFTNFLMHCLGRNYVVGDLHYLMTPENQENFTKEILKNEKVIFLYYARKKSKPEVMPQHLLGVSNVVLWFDRYSVDPVVLKDGGFEKELAGRWKMNIERLAKMDGR